MSTAATAMEIKRKVKAICRALAWGGPKPSPEELAGRCHACLITAASMRLIVAGHGLDSEFDDDLARNMAVAAFDAMDAVYARSMAARN